MERLIEIYFLIGSFQFLPSISITVIASNQQYLSRATSLSTNLRHRVTVDRIPPFDMVEGLIRDRAGYSVCRFKPHAQAYLSASNRAAHNYVLTTLDAIVSSDSHPHDFLTTSRPSRLTGNCLLPSELSILLHAAQPSYSRVSNAKVKVISEVGPPSIRYTPHCPEIVQLLCLTLIAAEPLRISRPGPQLVFFDIQILELRSPPSRLSRHIIWRNLASAVLAILLVRLAHSATLKHAPGEFGSVPRG